MVLESCPPPSHSQHTSLPAVEEAAGLPAVPVTLDTVSSADELSERAGSPLPALQPLAEAARAYAARRDSPNTRRAYASDWQLFERWCLRQGLDPLIPDPRIVGLFLAAAADGHGMPKVSVATLERRLAALTTRYRSSGTPLARDDRHITDIMAGIRRSHARPPRHKKAVLGEDLLAMVATLEADLRGLRDKAILLVGFAGGLRRSEIVGLDCDPRQTTEGVGWIEILAEGALLTVRGKTGWRVVEVGRGSSERSCPVAALETWLRPGRIGHGPVFRSIPGTKGVDSAVRLSDKHVVRLVKRTAMAAGLRGDLPDGERAPAFAGHSLRAGLASSAEVTMLCACASAAKPSGASTGIFSATVEAVTTRALDCTPLAHRRIHHDERRHTKLSRIFDINPDAWQEFEHGTKGRFLSSVDIIGAIRSDAVFGDGRRVGTVEFADVLVEGVSWHFTR